jgi:hypothetical protein
MGKGEQQHSPFKPICFQAGCDGLRKENIYA